MFNSNHSIIHQLFNYLLLQIHFGKQLHKASQYIGIFDQVLCIVIDQSRNLQRSGSNEYEVRGRLDWTYLSGQFCAPGDSADHLKHVTECTGDGLATIIVEQHSD